MKKHTKYDDLLRMGFALVLHKILADIYESEGESNYKRDLYILFTRRTIG